VVDTDQKTPGRNDSCQLRWARLIIFLNKACVIEDSKNSGNGRHGNFPRALVWSLPSPNSNEQALHETKRCDVTNDDEDVHFYSITKQSNFSQLSKLHNFDSCCCHLSLQQELHDRLSQINTLTIFTDM
jgi:translation elongation factor P/translation initiation factor 5A